MYKFQLALEYMLCNLIITFFIEKKFIYTHDRYAHAKLNMCKCNILTYSKFLTIFLV